MKKKITSFLLKLAEKTVKSTVFLIIDLIVTRVLG